jgi:CBS domain-containing protein
MLVVSEILRVKGTTLYTASPDMKVTEAINAMSEADIGSLVVMQAGSLVGMLTFREIIRHIHANQGSIDQEIAIHSIMDGAPVCVSPNTSADEVQRLMLDKHARYIPVMEGNTLLGVISFFDMAKAIVKEQKFENNMLKAYIRDWPMDSEESAAS